MGRKGNAACTVEGCERKELARGWCVMHYNRWRAGRELGDGTPRRAANGTADGPCSVEGCDTPMHARGFCPTHLNRFKLYGDPLGVAPPRPKATIEEVRRLAFEGAPGGTLSTNGYRYRSCDGKHVADHRLVMEHILGRLLEPYENVHHRNGVRDDNRPGNLELWTKPQVAGRRVDDLVAWVVDHYPQALRAALDGSPGPVPGRGAAVG